MTRRSPPTDRVVGVLEVLTANAGRPLTFTEIMRDVDISRATCHALLLTLVEAGYVIRDESSKTYLLGPALIAVGRAAEQTFPHVPAVRHLVSGLVAATGKSCALTTVTGDSMIVLDHDGSVSGDDYLRRGNLVPFAAPYGVVHAAWAAPPVRRRWARRGLDGQVLDDGAPDDGAHDAVLAEVRERGFSVAPLDDARRHLRELLALVKQDILSDELRQLIERTSGPVARDYLWSEITARRRVPVSSISSPVFDADGGVTFALHLQVLDPRVTTAAVLRFATAVGEVAAQASELVCSLARVSPAASGAPVPRVRSAAGGPGTGRG